VEAENLLPILNVEILFLSFPSEHFARGPLTVRLEAEYKDKLHWGIWFLLFRAK
jgi:hypothetical protein